MMKNSYLPNIQYLIIIYFIYLGKYLYRSIQFSTEWSLDCYVTSACLL